MIRAFVLAQLLLAPVDTGNFIINVSRPPLMGSGIVSVRPIPVTRIISDIGGTCPMFMFSDSSIVLRTFQKVDTMCVRKFNMIPTRYRKTVGYVQQRVDLICLVIERAGACDAPLIQTLFNTLSMGWSQCTPYTGVCGTPTTVVDFNKEFVDLYHDTCCTWTPPTAQFPARYETADYWLFFVRRE